LLKGINDVSSGDFSIERKAAIKHTIERHLGQRAGEIKMRKQAILAAKTHDAKQLRAALDEGISINTKEKDGYTLFQLFMRFPCVFRHKGCCDDSEMWRLFLSFNANLQGSVDRELESFDDSYQYDINAIVLKSMSAIHWAYLICGAKSEEFNHLIDAKETDLNARCDQTAEQEMLFFTESSLGGALWSRQHTTAYALEEASVLHFAIANVDLDTVRRLLAKNTVNIQQPLMLVQNKHLVNEDTCCDDYQVDDYVYEHYFSKRMAHIFPDNRMTLDESVADSLGVEVWELLDDSSDSDESIVLTEEEPATSHRFLHLKTQDKVSLYVARSFPGVLALRRRNVTALHIAAMTMKADISRALLSAGALCDAKDNFDLSPAEYYQDQLLRNKEASRRAVQNYEWLVEEEARSGKPLPPSIVSISEVMNGLGSKMPEAKARITSDRKSISTYAFEHTLESNVSAAPLTAAQHLNICNLFGVTDRVTRDLIRETQRQLLVGEAGMMFTLAYLLKYFPGNVNVGLSLIATEYLPYHVLREQEGDSLLLRLKFLRFFGVRVFFGVDATKLAIYRSLGMFTQPHLLRFNCPHDRGDIHKQTLPRILEAFFQEASRIQWENDIVLVTLPHPPELEIRQHRQAYIYGIYKASADAGYVLTEVRPFDGEYSAYQHRKTAGAESAPIAESCAEFVFRKSNLSPWQIWAHPLYGPGGPHYKRGREFYYLPELEMMPAVQPDLHMIGPESVAGELRNLETQILINEIVLSVRAILAARYIPEVIEGLSRLIVITRLIVGNNCLSYTDVDRLSAQYARINPVCEDVSRYQYYPRFHALYFESKKLQAELQEYKEQGEGDINSLIPMRRFA